MLSSLITDEAMFDINTDLIDMNAVSWQYDGMFEDVVVDDTRYGIITIDFPIFSSYPDFMVQFFSLSKLDEKQFPEFDLIQTGSIVMILYGYDTQDVNIQKKAIKRLLFSSFPNRTIQRDTALLAFE